MAESSGDGAGIALGTAIMIAAYVALGVAIWWWA